MRVLVAAAACLLVAGCFGAGGGRQPAPVLYRIAAPALPAGEAIAADLRVTVAASAPGLDGTGIAGRWPGARLDYFAGARWPVPAPEMVESALIEALQRTGRLRSVQGDFGRLSQTHALVVELRRFEADYTTGGLPLARVALAVTVARHADRAVLASFEAAAEERAAENRVSAIVAALESAFARAAAEAAEKGLAAVAADARAAPQPAAPANIGP